MEKFKLGINSDRIDLHVAGSLIVAALQMENVELIPKPRWNETDLLLNIDSIHNTQLYRGKKLTGYWEIDDNLHQGKNDEYYDFNGNRVVNFEDFLLFSQKFGAKRNDVKYDYNMPNRASIAQESCNNSTGTPAHGVLFIYV